MASRGVAASGGVKAQVGHMRIVVDLDFYDPGAFEQAVKEVIESMGRQDLSSEPRSVTRCSVVWPGRAPLTEQEWGRRYGVVRRILEERDEMGISLEQACAREGIPYSTFRYWRRRMTTDG